MTTRPSMVLWAAVAKFSSSDEQPAPENQGGNGEDENSEQGLGF